MDSCEGRFAVSLLWRVLLACVVLPPTGMCFHICFVFRKTRPLEGFELLLTFTKLMKVKKRSGFQFQDLSCL